MDGWSIRGGIRNAGSFVEPLEERRLLSAVGIHAAALPVTGVVAGNNFYQTLAELTPATTNSTSQSAKIEWGDGSKPDSQPLIPQSGKVIVIAGHTYARPGLYRARITLMDGKKVLARVVDRIRVARNSAGGVTIDARTGQVMQGIIGTFVSPVAPTGIAIQWGDGTQGLGTLLSLGNNRYQVTSAHTYASPGNYQVPGIVAVGGEDPLPIHGLPLPERDQPTLIGGGLLLDSTVRVTGRPVKLPAPPVQLTPAAAPLIYADTFNVPLAQMTGLAPNPYISGPYATISFDGGAPIVNGVQVQYQNGHRVAGRVVRPGGADAAGHDHRRLGRRWTDQRQQWGSGHPHPAWQRPLWRCRLAHLRRPGHLPDHRRGPDRRSDQHRRLHRRRVRGGGNCFIGHRLQRIHLHWIGGAGSTPRPPRGT